VNKFQHAEAGSKESGRFIGNSLAFEASQSYFESKPFAINPSGNELTDQASDSSVEVNVTVKGTTSGTTLTVVFIKAAK
jgi:hypothetical protein